MNKWEIAQTLEPKHWLENVDKINADSYRKTVRERSRYVLKQIEFVADISSDSNGLEIGGGATPLILDFPVSQKRLVDPLMDFYLQTFPDIFQNQNSLCDNAKGENLPYEDNSFDYIISRNVLDHVEDVDICLSEMARVLRRDGSAYIGMNVFAGALFLYKDIFKDPEHPYTFSKSRFLKLIEKYFDIKSIIVDNKINGNHFSEMEDESPVKSYIRNFFIRTGGYSLIELVVTQKRK